MTPIPLGILDFPTGAAGAYDLLETQVLTSDTASVTFTGLGSYTDYKHLQLRMVAITPFVRTPNIQFNADTGTNYSLHYLLGTGSSVISGGSTSTANPYAGYSDDTGGAAVLDILDFSNTNKYTTFRSLAGQNDSSAPRIGLFSGLWMNTNAVTSFRIYVANGDDLVTGSRFSLYGIKGA